MPIWNQLLLGCPPSQALIPSDYGDRQEYLLQDIAPGFPIEGTFEPVNGLHHPLHRLRRPQGSQSVLPGSCQTACCKSMALSCSMYPLPNELLVRSWIQQSCAARTREFDFRNTMLVTWGREASFRAAIAAVTMTPAQFPRPKLAVVCQQSVPSEVHIPCSHGAPLGTSAAGSLTVCRG